MHTEVKIGDITARVERPVLSNVVGLTIGYWPAYTTLSLTQRTARELGMALMQAGFEETFEGEAQS